MTFWGTLAGGGQMLLGAPKEAVLSYDREAPACQLKAIFPAERIWEDLEEVRVYEGGRGLFRGMVDEQNTAMGPKGLLVELVCRSREALLLDNEAEPRAFGNPSLGAIRRRLLEPLGFDQVTGEDGRFPGELLVEKGRSCWQVLAEFCQDYLGTRPYVDFEGVLHCEGAGPRGLELDRVMEAKLCRLPCKRLSALYKQGYRGGYDTRFTDPEAAVPRRRYISAQSGQNPRQLLKEARQASFLLTVTCAGAWWPQGDCTARVALPRVGRFVGCPVKKAVVWMDGSGVHTRLTLEKGEDERVADREA